MASNDFEIEQVHQDSFFLDNSRFPDNWSPRKKWDFKDILKGIGLHHDDYTPPPGVYIKNVTDSDEKSYSSHVGLGEGEAEDHQLMLRINENRKLEASAHELGHDVETQLISGLDIPRMYDYALREMFADLNALYFTKAVPDQREFTRDPFQDEYESFYQTAKEFLDPELYGEELKRLELMRELFEAEDYGDLQTFAEHDVVPPRSDYSGEDNLVSHLIVDNFEAMDTLRFLKYRIQPEIDLLNRSKDDNIVNEVVDYVLDGKDSSLGSEIAGASTALCGAQDIGTISDNSDEIVEYLVDRDIQNMLEISRAHLERLEEGVSEVDVVRNINDMQYGKSFDRYVSFPHHVGGMEAEKTYLNGVKPGHVVENTPDYLVRLTESMNDTLDQALEL